MLFLGVIGYKKCREKTGRDTEHAGHFRGPPPGEAVPHPQRPAPWLRARVPAPILRDLAANAYRRAWRRPPLGFFADIGGIRSMRAMLAPAYPPGSR